MTNPATDIEDFLNALRNEEAVLGVAQDDTGVWHELNVHDLRAVVNDAKRYQWLRNRDVDAIHRGGVFAGVTPQNLVINLADLDQHIDAEILSVRIAAAYQEGMKK